MIVQRFLDALSIVIGSVFGLVPDLPPVLTEALAEVQSAGQYLGGLVTQFGILMPWESFAQVVAWWIAGLAFWGAITLVRVVLWAIGR